jgi:hypothetical protein
MNGKTGRQSDVRSRRPGIIENNRNLLFIKQSESMCNKFVAPHSADDVHLEFTVTDVILISWWFLVFKSFEIGQGFKSLEMSQW